MANIRGKWSLGTVGLRSFDGLDNLRWVNYAGFGREPQQHRFDVDANNRHWQYFITNGTASITRLYAHDARGNRLASTTPGPAFGTRNYTYDRTNRMTSSNDGATWEYYWYDGHGRRTVINRPGGNTVQIYSRDGRLVYERAPGGSTTKHIYLAGRLVGSMTGATTTYLHTDTLGTVVRRTNAAGLELGPRQTWEPYGSLSNGQYLQAPGFTGHVTDVHSGLIYMQQRHYDPVAMRFMSVDPVHVDTGSGGNFNRYWYANNNPYRYVDPDGRAAEAAWDAFNHAMGATSMVGNLRGRNWSSAAIDFLGMTIDGAAAVIPFVPGGAGSVIAARRMSMLAADASRGWDSAETYIRSISRDFAATSGRPSAETLQGFASGGREAAEGVFARLTNGNSIPRDGGQLGRLGDGSHVQMSTRTLRDGTTETNIRITRDRPGSHIKENIKVRFRHEE